MSEDYDSLYYLSNTLGWIYFFAWSFSFYGQVVENYRRKSVRGLSFDFEVYNLLGFTGYSVYTIWGYLDKNIGTGQVAFQDIVFAIHAWILTVVTIVQIFYYYDRDDTDQKVSGTCITIVLCLVWGVLNIVFVERILGLYDPHITPGKATAFNSVIYLGWCKVFISLIKYIPQVISNYNRKSTEGWSIHNILLDFTGGSFSFAQNIVDVYRDDFSFDKPGQSHSLNIAKFALSFISIFFDLIFVIQHYFLYNKPKTEEEKKYEYLINDFSFTFTKN